MDPVYVLLLVFSQWRFHKQLPCHYLTFLNDAIERLTLTKYSFAEACIKWDVWVDTHQPSLMSRDDIEPIDVVLAESRTCKDPLVIQCRTATTDHTPWEVTGQQVRCNLWDGLMCKSSNVQEPSCFNYEVRLGCLKRTNDCGMTIIIFNLLLTF